MKIQDREIEEQRPMTTTILYGILIIIVAVVAVVLVARYAFNVDLVNFDQLLGMTKADRPQR